MSARRPRVTSVALLLALAIGGPATAQIGEPQLPEVDWEQRLGERVPLDARFRDVDGVEVRLGRLLGDRPAVLALVYFECPMLCDMVLSGLLASLRSLEFDVGGEFDVVVVSIDPEESSELARAKRDGYVERYGRAGGAAGWHFLTGDEPGIAALADAVGYRFVYVPETDEYAHPAGVAVLTREGSVARILYGNEFSARDLKFSLMEADENRIGSPLDKVILRCFHYDPTRGEYGFAIMTTLRLAGTLTVGVLVLAIARTLRRERGARTARGGAPAA